MELPPSDQALATSGGHGFRFDRDGRFHHIFDPTSGACPHTYASVFVVAPKATAADALSTACHLLPLDAPAAPLRAPGATRAVISCLRVARTSSMPDPTVTLD
jgi:thiamine biosynthesis lipoprotein